MLAGECTKEHRLWMMTKCKKSCGLCKHNCFNDDINCDWWAKQGECTKNKV